MTSNQLRLGELEEAQRHNREDEDTRLMGARAAQQTAFANVMNATSNRMNAETKQKEQAVAEKQYELAQKQYRTDLGFRIFNTLDHLLPGAHGWMADMSQNLGNLGRGISGVTNSAMDLVQYGFAAV